MNLLRRLIYRCLRPLVVTAHEERTLAWAHAAAPHAELLKKRYELEAVIVRLRADLAQAAAADVALDEVRRALEAPQRFMPEPALTPREAAQWGAHLASPLGLKIDTAMCNWTQQQCQAACATQADQRDYAAGFARGTVVSWQMAKTISRLVLATEDHSENDASTTTDAGLANYQP